MLVPTVLNPELWLTGVRRYRAFPTPDILNRPPSCGLREGGRMIWLRHDFSLRSVI